jgi:hypothetical protein
LAPGTTHVRASYQPSQVWAVITEPSADADLLTGIDVHAMMGAASRITTAIAAVIARVSLIFLNLDTSSFLGPKEDFCIVCRIPASFG